MSKKTAKPRSATKNRSPRKDVSQTALSVVEQIIGGKLSDGMELPKRNGPVRRGQGRRGK